MRRIVDGRRRGSAILTFLAGAMAGLGSARLIAARPGARPDGFGPESGRGSAGDAPSRMAQRAGYEPADAVAGRIGWIMALFAGSALAAIGLMATLLHVLHGHDRAREAGLSRIQRHPIETAGPRLQADPVRDLATLRGRQYALLHTTARLDAATARIPIERAMALMVGQTLDRPDTQGDGRPGAARGAPR